MFLIELVAHLTMFTAKGRAVEQKRVRAHVSDTARFAATVIEQMEWACHSCPGVEVEVSHDAASIWTDFAVGLGSFPASVRMVVERTPMYPEDLELVRRARRRP